METIGLVYKVSPSSEKQFLQSYTKRQKKSAD